MVRAQINNLKPDWVYIFPEMASPSGTSEMNTPKTPIKTTRNTRSSRADSITNSAGDKEQLYIGSGSGSDGEREVDHDSNLPDDWEDLMDTYTFATSSQLDLPVYVKM